MGIAELPGPGGDRSLDLRRRTRLARRWRLVLLAFVIAYFFAPYDVHYWIPAWIPFLVAVYLEAHFFVGGYLRARRGVVHGRAGTDRGPQPRDLADFGGEAWREVMPIEIDGERHFVPIQGLSDEEVEERVVEFVGDPEALRAARRP
jgi:hypothetical protein